MMHKERLEEIKKELELDWSDISYVVNQDDVKWLIEQAKRVQELEEELYGNDIQMGYKRMYGSCNRDYAKLLQQNKRYREALSIISANLPLDEREHYVDIARQALEESE